MSISSSIFGRRSASKLMLALLLTLIFSCSKDSSNVENDPNAAGEATLKASDPLLKSLSAAETGIDFRNDIVETFENNVTTNRRTTRCLFHLHDGQK
jgi:hypothetical protein